MDFFDKYVSDTIASTGNQSWFSTDGKVGRGRIFYRLESKGSNAYSLLFSSRIDSTFSDGTHSRADIDCLFWTIKRVSVCVTNECRAELDEGEFIPLTFDGKTEKVVDVSGFFATDEVILDTTKGEFLCVDVEFIGDKIPYHEECCLIPLFICEDGKWTEGRKMPVPCMVGVKRTVKKRVTFWGDSITQGIGTPCNSYSHYAAVVSELLGNEYACWNIGLGFGRANDAGLLKSWYERARHSDVVVVCFGVNDILRVPCEKQIKADLKHIVTALKSEGIKVVLQTVPPFDYNEEKRVLWESVNAYVKTELALIVDAVFDCVPVLGEKDALHKARYGGHPSLEGAKIWGESLYPIIAKLCEKL